MNDKDKFMLEGFKRAFPGKTNRLEKDWNAKIAPKPSDWSQATENTVGTAMINWFKPIEFVEGHPYGSTHVEFKHHVWIEESYLHLCKRHCTNNTWYYCLYDDHGNFVGGNTNKLRIRNSRTLVKRVLAIDVETGNCVATCDEIYEARRVAKAKGYDNIITKDVTYYK